MLCAGYETNVLRGTVGAGCAFALKKKGEGFQTKTTNECSTFAFHGQAWVELGYESCKGSSSEDTNAKVGLVRARGYSGLALSDQGYEDEHMELRREGDGWSKLHRLR